MRKTNQRRVVWNDSWDWGNISLRKRLLNKNLMETRELPCGCWSRALQSKESWRTQSLKSDCVCSVPPTEKHLMCPNGEQSKKQDQTENEAQNMYNASSPVSDRGGFIFYSKTGRLWKSDTYTETESLGLWCHECSPEAGTEVRRSGRNLSQQLKRESMVLRPNRACWVGEKW